jgi:hypothetical protein
MRGRGIDDTQSLLLGVGETIDGAYRIRGVLGYGGMGEVYEAEELLLGRSVALKIASDPRAGLLGGRRIYEGDRDYNRGSLNPNRR